MNYKDYLTAAAKAAAEQLTEDAALHVPLDPDVADLYPDFGQKEGVYVIFLHINPCFFGAAREI